MTKGATNSKIRAAPCGWITAQGSERYCYSPITPTYPIQSIVRLRDCRHCDQLLLILTFDQECYIYVGSDREKEVERGLPLRPMDHCVTTDPNI